MTRHRLTCGVGVLFHLLAVLSVRRDGGGWHCRKMRDCRTLSLAGGLPYLQALTDSANPLLVEEWAVFLISPFDVPNEPVFEETHDIHGDCGFP